MTRAFLPVLFGVLFFALPVSAHPHVWIEADATVVLGSNGHITALNIAWTFDELYSEDTAIDVPGRTPADLRPLLADTLPNLKPWLYFTDLRVNGARQAFGTVKTYEARWQDGRLTYAFTLPLAPAVAVSGLPVALRMYDPTYFVDIAVPEDSSVTVTPDGSGCAVSRHPAPEKPDIFVLSDAYRTVPVEPGGEGIGAGYAEIWRLTCP